MAKSLVRLLEKLSSSFSMSAPGPEWKNIWALEEGLADLLQLKEVDPKYSGKWTFSENFGDGKGFRAGYLVLGDLPADQVDPGSLWVQEGCLFWGKDPKSLRPWQECDFWLIQISQLEQRQDYPAFPFYKLWEKAVQKLWERDQEQANFNLMQVIHEVTVSPYLTSSHRHNLIQMFRANFDKEKESLRQTIQGKPTTR